MVRLVELNVSSRFHDDHTIVTICGEIDLYTAPRLHSELGAVLVDGMPTRVVIDMSGVEFCDSTGMNVLLSYLRRVRERGGELEIASPKPAVRKILQVTGLDSVFTLVDDAVVIPARNEADRIAATVTAAAGLAGVGLVVVVDDGSRDGTGVLARRAGAVVMRHARNRGKAAAMATGAG